MRRAVAALLLTGGCSAAAVPPESVPERARATAVATGTPGVDAPQRGLAVVPLRIDSRGRVHRFRVEIARTAEEQRIGMMFRTAVGPNRGMIFPYAQPALLGFWMRNTPVPLDIIYVRPDGTIESIHNARPFDETSVRSGEPVSLVLEIAGGRAARLGIRPGDRVSYPGFPGPALPAPAPRG